MCVFAPDAAFTLQPAHPTVAKQVVSLPKKILFHGVLHTIFFVIRPLETDSIFHRGSKKTFVSNFIELFIMSIKSALKSSSVRLFAWLIVDVMLILPVVQKLIQLIMMHHSHHVGVVCFQRKPGKTPLKNACFLLAWSEMTHLQGQPAKGKRQHGGNKQREGSLSLLAPLLLAPGGLPGHWVAFQADGNGAVGYADW